MPNKDKTMYAEAFRELEKEEKGFFANFSTVLRALKPARKSIQQAFERGAADTESAKKTEASKADTTKVAADKTSVTKVPVKKASTARGAADKTGAAKSSAAKPAIAKAATGKG